MGIRFERVLAQAKMMEVNHHNRTNGTFVRMGIPNFLVPLKNEFKKVWSDVHADWMKVTKGENGRSTVDVVLLISQETFQKKFPKAVYQAENNKLHQRYEQSRSLFAGYQKKSNQRGRAYA